jgi:hypothetical protein
VNLVAQRHEVERAGLWSIMALVFAGLGVAVAAWLVVALDSDPSGVLWPLVLLPVAIAIAPVLVPRRGVRLAAAFAMGAWCVVTGFSIGILLLPALAALIVASVREVGP